MIRALRHHWPEYLMEAAGLGIFMVSAVVFATTLQHPSSPISQAIDDPLLRRTLMGIAMGMTAIGIIYSPWGQQSGAHINPAITVTFLRLGKIERWDAFFYVGAQFVSGAAGVMLATLPLRAWAGDPAVNYVETVPGQAGTTVAFVAELVMSFILMTTVLITSNSRRLSRLTGLFAGVLVATYITFEAPFSGMSINPARTVASALLAQQWTALWLYFTAPPLGMLLGAEVYRRWRGAAHVLCAKLNHYTGRRCIFHCGYKTAQTG